MKNFKTMLFLMLTVLLMLFIVACTSQGDASTPGQQESQPIVDLSESDQTDPDTEEPSPEPPETETSETMTYGFEGSMDNWVVSDWVSDNDGELGFTKVEVSSDQKASGSSSAAISCEFTGKRGSSRTYKGALKMNFESPVDLRGKIVSAKIYIPDELLSDEFKSNSYGVQLYIKTTDSWTWSDGGWIDVANSLKPGWNEITFAPIGAKESETREIGITLSKGDNSPDWNGTIYIDDISY